MRIFFIATKLNFSMGGSMVENDLICRKLQELGNKVTMLTVFSKANDFPKGLSYRLIEEELGATRQLGIQWGVFKLMRKYSDEADVFYIEGQTFFYGAGLYRWLGGPRPVAAFFVREQVSWPENVSVFLSFEPRRLFLFHSLKRKIRWYIERYLLIYFANFVDYFTFDSPLLRREYEEFGLKTKDKNIIIGDPYPFDEIMQKYGLSENSYAERKNKRDKVILFYSSRMVPGKGFDVLIKAFSQVKNKENFKLVLGGDGPEKPLIEKMVKDLGLAPLVQMPGWISKEKFHEALKEADIFIHPRWRTAQPSLGLSEAMAFGLPSIVPEGTGLHWVAGKSALAFELDNAQDLARKIEILGNNAELRRELSRQCYLRLKEADVNYQKTIPQVYEIMKRLVRKAS